jgi:glycosyltransferase involved in cell wall biosynthesis
LKYRAAEQQEIFYNEMKQATLSVIVANYNKERFIRECLESILNQTYKDLEIIVNDDYSTDSSPDIIREYQENYQGIVKGIFSPVNRGVAQNRHEAILQANTEYITTLDSDDYYDDPRKLEKEMALISHYKKEQGKDIIAFSNILLVKGDKTLIKTWGNPGNIKQGKIFYEMITRNCMIPRDFVMKRDAYFEAGGFDFRFSIYEDWDLKIRLAKRYEFYYTGINGTAYRRHGAGLSAVPISRNIKGLKKVFKKNKALIDKAQRKDAVRAIGKFTKAMKTNNRKRNLNRSRKENQ